MYARFYNLCWRVCKLTSNFHHDCYHSLIDLPCCSQIWKCRVGYGCSYIICPPLGEFCCSQHSSSCTSFCVDRILLVPPKKFIKACNLKSAVSIWGCQPSSSTMRSFQQDQLVVSQVFIRPERRRVCWRKSRAQRICMSKTAMMTKRNLHRKAISRRNRYFHFCEVSFVHADRDTRYSKVGSYSGCYEPLSMTEVWC